MIRPENDRFNLIKFKAGLLVDSRLSDCFAIDPLSTKNELQKLVP